MFVSEFSLLQSPFSGHIHTFTHTLCLSVRLIHATELLNFSRDPLFDGSSKQMHTLRICYIMDVKE